MNTIGCNSKQLADILSFCGFDNIFLGDERKIFFLKQKNQKKSQKLSKKNNIKKSKTIISQRKNIKTDPNSPFAVLQKLL